MIKQPLYEYPIAIGPEHDERAQELKELLLAQLAINHGLVEDIQALQDELYVDQLTGVLTEEGFWAQIDQLQTMIDQPREEWLWRDRNDKHAAEFTDEPIHSLEIVAFDLDGFKILNDALGHAAGDHALQAFGAILKNSFRESDLILRSSKAGDEFYVVAPVTEDDEDRAKDIVLSKIYGAIDDLKMIDGLNDIPREKWAGYLGTSFGVSRLELEQGMDVKKALREAMDVADQALLENKGDKAR